MLELLSSLVPQSVLDMIHLIALCLGYFVLFVWTCTVLWLIASAIREIRFNIVQRRKDEEEWLTHIRQLNAELKAAKVADNPDNQTTDVFARDELDLRLKDWADVLSYIPTPRITSSKENHQ